MFKPKTLKGYSFGTRAKVVSPTLVRHDREFVMGALSRLLSRRFSLAGHPIVVTRQQYATSRVKHGYFSIQNIYPRYLDGMLPGSENPIRINKVNKVVKSRI